MADNLLVTGRWGTPHVTSAQQRETYAGICGTGQYVMGGLSASMTSANTCHVEPGTAMMNGASVQVPAGGVDVTIDNGTQGQNRNDLVVIRYTSDGSGGTESAELVAIKGTPTTGAASDPAYNSGSILDGGSTVDMPLYRIPLTGVSVGAPVAMYSTIYNLSQLSPYDGPKVFVGSSVKQGTSNTSLILFTQQEFISNFGRAYNNSTDFVGVMNGDGSANSVHIDCATYNQGSVYAVFDSATSGSVRINWFVVLG